MFKKPLSDADKHRKRHHKIFRNIPPIPLTSRRSDDDISREIKRQPDLKKRSACSIDMVQI